MPAEDPKVLVYYAFQADYDKNAHVKSDAIKSVLRKVAMTYNFAGQQDVSEPSAPSAEIVPIHESTMPSLINHTLTYAQNKLADSECDVIVLGGGEEIIDQFPQAGEMVVTRQKIFLLTDTYQITMPDMNGWTRKEVSGFWKASGLPVKIEGYGKVVSRIFRRGRWSTSRRQSRSCCRNRRFILYKQRKIRMSAGLFHRMKQR